MRNDLTRRAAAETPSMMRMIRGSLYPMLHGLERRGYLKSKQELKGKRLRRTYRATPKGRKALEADTDKAQELFGELFEDD